VRCLTGDKNALPEKRRAGQINRSSLCTNFLLPPTKTRKSFVAYATFLRKAENLLLAPASFIALLSDLAKLGYLHYYPGSTNPLAKMTPEIEAVFAKTLAKAIHTDNRALLPKVVEPMGNGGWKFKEDPPVLIAAHASKAKTIDALNRYTESTLGALRIRGVLMTAAQDLVHSGC